MISLCCLLLEILSKTKKIDLNDFANKMSMPVIDAYSLLNGKLELTSSIAEKLEEITNVPSSFWIRREYFYREDLKRVGKALADQ